MGGAWVHGWWWLGGGSVGFWDCMNLFNEQGFHAVILHHFASMLYIVAKCHNQLLPYLQLKGLLVKYGTLSINEGG